MTKILGITKEQERQSRRNHRKAWKHFWPEGNGKALDGYCLHHINTDWRHNDIERYIQWNIDDLVMMKFDEHTSLHLKEAHSNGWTPYSDKSEEELNTIADKKRHTWNSKEHPKLLHRAERYKGKDNPMYGVSCTYKMTQDDIDKWKSHIRDTMTGLLCWNDGKTVIRARECPGDGWVRGKLKWTPEQKKSLSEKRKGYLWFNNGIDEKFVKECPGDGWVRGRLKQ